MSRRDDKHPPALPSIFAMLGAILQRGNTTITSAQSRRWSSSWFGAGIMLIVLCLAVYLPGLRSIPPVDRDESRFAQASRTMLESGDFVVPRIQNTPRLNKPPLIYWLQSGSAYLLGDAPGPDGLGQWGNGNIWVFRLPSALCALGTILLTWRLGLRMFDPRAAALAAALLAVCPMVVWDAHQARADQLLLFTTTGTMFALFVCWKRTTSVPPSCESSSTTVRPPRIVNTSKPSILWPVTFWFFLALGIFAKGPITPLIAALTIITLCISTRSFRWLLHLRPFLGLLILTAIVGPWVYAIIHRVGWSTYWPIIFKETIGRSIDSKDAENHWGPPGYHTILLAALFWPGSLLTLAAITRAIKQVWRTTIRVSWPRKGLASQPRSGASSLPWASAHGSYTPSFQAPEGRHTPAPHPHPHQHSHPNTSLFLLAWLLPSWLLFECIATKLPHYTMPLYPAIALLTARAAFSISIMQLRAVGSRIGAALWSGIGFFGLSLFLILVAAAGGIREYTPPSAIWLGAFYLVLLGIMIYLAHRAISRGQLIRAHAIAIVAMVSWVHSALGAVLPLSRDLWISPRIATAVMRTPADALAPIALVGYQEDSTLFLFRGRAERVEPAHFSEWIARNPTGCVAIEPARAPEAAKTAAASLALISAIDGYNYSIGKRATVEVYAPRPLPVTNP